MMDGMLLVARLKSERLKRKVELPIDGVAMIAHQIRRLKALNLPKLAIITSDLSDDDNLQHIAEAEDVECYRGDPQDVLKRIHDAAHLFDLQNVMVATADNPFVCLEHIQRQFVSLRSGNVDFNLTENLPLGCGAWGMTRCALGRAMQIKAPGESEFWVGYFLDSGIFECKRFQPVEMKYRRPEIRLTVDYPEDFEVISKIMRALNRNCSLNEIISFLDLNPDIAALNSALVQRPWSPPKFKERSSWPQSLLKESLI